MKCKNCGADLVYEDKNKNGEGYYVCPECGARYAVVKNAASESAQAQPLSAIQDTAFNSNEHNSQLKYFKFYKNLPKIVLILTLVVYFLIGVSLAIAIGGGIGAVIWFGCMIVGAVVSFLGYVFAKIACSHKLLQIYYLQKIAGVKCGILDD